MHHLCERIGQCMLDGHWVHNRAQHDTLERFSCYLLLLIGYVWSIRYSRRSTDQSAPPNGTMPAAIASEKDLHHMLHYIPSGIPFRLISLAHHEGAIPPRWYHPPFSSNLPAHSPIQFLLLTSPHIQTAIPTISLR